ncbi:MAG: hypothetical protein NC452_14725, partial [Eubacterium sp.]|nr:hypothetical protein [Eubacterium sp.]
MATDKIVEKIKETDLINDFANSIKKTIKSNQKKSNSYPKTQTKEFKTQYNKEIELTKLSDFPLNRFPLY